MLESRLSQSERRFESENNWKIVTWNCDVIFTKCVPRALQVGNKLFIQYFHRYPATHNSTHWIQCDFEAEASYSFYASWHKCDSNRITAKRIKWKFQDSYFAKLNHKRQEWQVEIQARLLWNLGESRQVYFNLIHNSDRDTTRSHVHRIEWVPSMFKFGHVDEVCEFKVQQTW